MADIVVEMLERGYADLEWFGANQQRLQKKYDGKFIAVFDKKVVAAKGSTPALLEDLKGKDIDSRKVTIKHVSKVPYLL